MLVQYILGPALNKENSLGNMALPYITDLFAEPFRTNNAVNIQDHTKHLYSICTTSAQRLRCWTNIVHMLYKCAVFTGMFGKCWPNVAGLALNRSCGSIVQDWYCRSNLSRSERCDWSRRTSRPITSLTFRAIASRLYRSSHFHSVTYIHLSNHSPIMKTAANFRIPNSISE